jgi:hypothetical protein
MTGGPNWMMILFIGAPVVAIVLWYLLRGMFSRDDDSK